MKIENFHKIKFSHKSCFSLPGGDRKAGFCDFGQKVSKLLHFLKFVNFIKFTKIRLFRPWAKNNSDSYGLSPKLGKYWNFAKINEI